MNLLASGYQRIVTRSGPWARRCLPVLSMASVAWRVLVRLDRWRTASRTLPRPVLSVGNITLGGTGKTPFVMWLGRHLIQDGLRVAVLTRGYRAGGSGADEPGLLNKVFGEGRVLVGKNRHQNALRAMAAPRPPDAFLLDDGFQHWRLARDLDIVLVDALSPFGFGRVCPAGFLREDLSALGRAQCVVITRADLVAPETLGLIKSYLRGRFPGLLLAEAREQVTGFRCLSGTSCDPPEGAAFAVCGIGNPAGFFRRLNRQSGPVAGCRRLPDHHAWTAGDAAEVERTARLKGAAWIATTEKDANKIQPDWTEMPWRVMSIDLDFLSGEAAVLALCRKMIKENGAFQRQTNGRCL